MRPFDPRVLPHLAPAKASLVVLTVASIVGAASTIAIAFTLGTLVVKLLSDPSGDTWHQPLWALIAATGIRAASNALTDWGAVRAAGQVSVHLRTLLMAHTLTKTPAPEVGPVGLLATRGVSATEPYFTRYLPTLVLASVLPLMTLVAIATQDIWSAVIVICTLPLLPLFAILIGLATKEKADRQWRALGLLAGHFLDVVKGLPTLVAYRRAGAQSKRIREVTNAYRSLTLDTLKVAFISSAALELIATISVALVAVTVGLRLAHGSMDFTTALIVLLLAPEAYWPWRRVGAEFHAAAEGAATFDQIQTLLDTTGSDHVATTDHGPASLSTTVAPIVLKDLSLGYDDLAVIRELSAVIPPVGLTAITGPSGCGKSTLLTALTGELKPASGTITWAGSKIGGESWHQSVAYVGQRPWIVSGSIADNVRIGRPEASDTEVDQALQLARLPLPQEAQVGEDGRLLSAGQRARLALARVAVSDRPWLILDEPTAHLDDETEQALLGTLLDLAKQRAVVSVAHRPAIVNAAAQVIELPMREQPGGKLRSASASASGLHRSSPTNSFDSAPSRRPRGLAALGDFLSTMAASFGVALTATAGWLIARAAEQPPILYLMVAIVAVRLFGLGRPAWRYAERIVTHDAALRLLAERRAQVFDVLVPLTPARLGRRRGDLLASVVDDVDALVDQQLRVRQPVMAWLGTTMLAALVAALIWWPAAGWIAATSLMGGGLAWLFARTSARSHEVQSVRLRADLSALVVETLSHARNIVLWQRQPATLNELDRIGRQSAAAAQRTATGLIMGRTIALMAGPLGAAGIALTGHKALAEQSFSGPMMALLVMIPIAMVDVISPLADAGSLSVRTAAARNRIDALEAMEPAVSDPPTSAKLDGPASVALDSVSTGWSDEPTITGVSLDLPPGRRVGVVGPSGCGKSTLAALLLRFLPAHQGHYWLGDHDVAELNGDELRKHVGLVDDDPHVFTSNVAENIRLARPEATDEDIIVALHKAHLDSWLAQLPLGLGTRIGDGARQVSGGERARIGLARALLADLPVLVLDEPTAHLDTATATAVARDLLEASRQRSLVWITHTTIGLDQMDTVLTLGAAPDASEQAPAPCLVKPR